MACLIFKGRRTAKEGFSPDDLREILDRVNGGRTWAGKDAVITAIPVTVAEARHILAKARLFAQSQRKPKRQGPWGVATLADPHTPPTPETPARGRGRSDGPTNTLLSYWRRGACSVRQERKEWSA